MTLTLAQAVVAVEGGTELRVAAGAAAPDATWLACGERVLHLAVSPAWVQLATPAAAGAHPDPLDESYRRHMAKLARSPGGELRLEAELPQDGVDPVALLLAVAALSAPVPAYAALRGGAGADPREIVSESEMLLWVRTLAHEGWVLKDRIDTNHFRLGFSSADERQFSMYLGMGEVWTTFQLPLRGDHQPLSRPARAQLSRYLLAMNHLVYWAKLGMTGDEVVLSLDLPTEGLSLARFRQVLRTLGHYAQRVSSEVHILSQVELDPAILAYLEAGAAITGHPELE